MSYLPEPYTCGKSKIKVESNVSNYATKSDLKNATDVDTSELAKEVDLTSLKSKNR